MLQIKLVGWGGGIILLGWAYYSRVASKNHINPTTHPPSHQYNLECCDKMKTMMYNSNETALLVRVMICLANPLWLICDKDLIDKMCPTITTNTPGPQGYHLFTIY